MGGMRFVPPVLTLMLKRMRRVGINSDFLGSAAPFSEVMSHQVRIRRSIEATTSLVFLSRAAGAWLVAAHLSEVWCFGSGLAGNMLADPPCIDSFDVVRDKIRSLGDQVVDLFLRKRAFAKADLHKGDKACPRASRFFIPTSDFRPGPGAKLPGSIEAVNPDFPKDFVVPHIDVEQRGIVAGPSLKISYY